MLSDTILRTADDEDFDAEAWEAQLVAENKLRISLEEFLSKLSPSALAGLISDDLKLQAVRYGPDLRCTLDNVYDMPNADGSFTVPARVHVAGEDNRAIDVTITGDFREGLIVSKFDVAHTVTGAAAISQFADFFHQVALDIASSQLDSELITDSDYAVVERRQSYDQTVLDSFAVRLRGKAAFRLAGVGTLSADAFTYANDRLRLDGIEIGMDSPFTAEFDCVHYKLDGHEISLDA